MSSSNPSNSSEFSDETTHSVPVAPKWEANRDRPVFIGAMETTWRHQHDRGGQLEMERSPGCEVFEISAREQASRRETAHFFLRRAFLKRAFTIVARLMAGEPISRVWGAG